MNPNKVWLAFTMLLFVVVMIVALAIITTDEAWAIPPQDLKSDYDVKGGYSEPPRQEQLKIQPHPHPKEISEGQWGFWGTVVTALDGLAIVTISTLGVRRYNRRRREADE